jgi:hypothetical protein
MSAHISQPEYDDDYDECGCGDEDCPQCGGRNCWECGGDGWVDGAELADEDPFWYDADEIYKCPNCGGSGDGKDCTYW